MAFWSIPFLLILGFPRVHLLLRTWPILRQPGLKGNGLGLPVSRISCSVEVLVGNVIGLPPFRVAKVKKVINDFPVNNAAYLIRNPFNREITISLLVVFWWLTFTQLIWMRSIGKIQKCSGLPDLFQTTSLFLMRDLFHLVWAEENVSAIVLLEWKICFYLPTWSRYLSFKDQMENCQHFNIMEVSQIPLNLFPVILNFVAKTYKRKS